MASSGRKKSSTSLKTGQSAVEQQTISHLFAATQQKQVFPNVPQLSPSSKRKRSITSQHDCSPSKPTTTSNMYNFSQKASGGGVIDSSSPRNKQRRISIGAKVDNAPAQGGVKRLAVRNLKQPKPVSDYSDFVKSNIAMLDSALSAIFSNQRPAKASEELYRACENVCKMGHADEVAGLVLAKCKLHVIDDLKQPLAQLPADSEPVDVLRAVISTWQLWQRQMTEVQGIFFYLDRSYLLQRKSPSLHDESVSLFRTHIFEASDSARENVINGACQLLLAERERSIITDTALFSSAVKMFHDIQVYTTHFEPRMLAFSQTYISDWSDRECSRQELPDYVDVSVQLIEDEMKRCEAFQLDNTTRRSLLALLEDHLIERKYSELTNQDAVADILDASTKSAADNIKKLFDLLQRKRAGVRLKDSFSTWLEDTGSAIIFDEKEQDRMIERLLEFKQKLDHIWRKSFGKHEELGHALRSSFERFMNKSKKSSATWGTDNSRTGEMIAKYVDELLRKGAKGIPAQSRTGVKPVRVFTRAHEDQDPGDNMDVDDDVVVENQLDQVLDLFRFVHGKAVFEAFYKKDLARRLLLGRSASNDAEKNMLERLKTECGEGFTHNLEQMFKDTELADEEAKAYKSRFENSDRNGLVDLSVSVLSSAAWPSYPDIEVAIPLEVKKSLDDYAQFYHSKHSGRKLAWKHALAHCQMKADFPKGKKDLVVSAFQAVILLLFNGRGEEHLSYEHIKSESGLPAAEVERTLQSLACAKLRPLTKHPRGRDINKTDTFSVNTSFAHDKYRVKINSIQLKETKEENQETHVRVAADRQFETQAAIVRILKERKRIGHQQLIAQVIEKTRTRGVLQPAEIKKEIDKLIEKEYLERGEGNVYEYLA